MNEQEAIEKFRSLLVITQGKIENLAVPTRNWFGETLLTQINRQTLSSGNCFLENDPTRCFLACSSVTDMIRKVLVKPHKVAVAVTSKQFTKEAFAPDADWQNGSLMMGRFLSAIGALPGYDVVLGLSCKTWCEEQASIIDELGFDIVYDDTKKLKRFSKKLHSPDGIKLTFYHRDSWAPGSVRLLSKTGNSEQLVKFCEASSAAYACKKFLREQHLKLPNNRFSDELMVDIANVMMMGVAELEPVSPPAFTEELDAWTPMGAIQFVEGSSTLFSAARKWSGKRWYAEVYPVFCAMAPLWKEVLVGKTRGGNPKKSPINIELSKVISGEYEPSSPEAKAVFEKMAKEAEGTSIEFVAKALKQGVPVADIVA